MGMESGQSVLKERRRKSARVGVGMGKGNQGTCCTGDLGGGADEKRARKGGSLIKGGWQDTGAL